jgi:hypothetical protein
LFTRDIACAGKCDRSVTVFAFRPARRFQNLTHTVGDKEEQMIHWMEVLAGLRNTGGVPSAAGAPVGNGACAP